MSADDTPLPGSLRSLRGAFLPVALFVCVLWVTHLADWAASLGLARHGVYPRDLDHLYGVLWAPLIHDSWAHLLANTPPLLMLGTALLYVYPRSARVVVPAVYLGAGLAVWVFARPAFHIGASGLTFGVAFFIFSMGVLRWDRRAIALSMIVAFVYGSMVWGVLPGDPSVSFETHLAGALIGVALAYRLRRLDPPPPRKRYDWEGEDPDPGP